MASIEDRVRDLLKMHRIDEKWQDKAERLGASTTTRSLYEGEPILRRLRDLADGWLVRSSNTRVLDVYGSLQGLNVLDALELELVDDDNLDEAGPYSDFDPLNSVIVASVPCMSIWYSLLCLPGESLDRWPVVQCDPAAGDDAVMTVAVNVKHFIHQLMCREGPHYSSPLVMLPEHSAADIIRLMNTMFQINLSEATELLAARRRSRGLSVSGPVTGEALKPYVDPEVLRQLDRLAVLP